MGKRYLIDTNILIEYISGLLSEKAYSFVNFIIDEEFNISVINKIEVLGYENVNQKIEDFINLSNCIELSEIVANKTIKIRKTHKIKLPDAIIAATAIVNNLTLITRNTSDFSKIEELKTINPHLL